MHHKNIKCIIRKQMKKQYPNWSSLCVLNYIATSNHTHLLVVDTDEHTISKSLQLITGRTAQEYNLRKKRKGAFWQDRYHATAVQTNEHLTKCMVYFYLNMVRAGVVKHPSEYKICGYNEIQNPEQRYSVVNRNALLDLFALNDDRRLRQTHYEWVECELMNGISEKQSHWSTSVAVGNEYFIQDIQKKLVSRVQGRSIVSCGEIQAIQEPTAPYDTVFKEQMGFLSKRNTFFTDY